MVFFSFGSTENEASVFLIHVEISAQRVETNVLMKHLGVNQPYSISLWALLLMLSNRYY
jgi:hypothetical protein